MGRLAGSQFRDVCICTDPNGSVQSGTVVEAAARMVAERASIGMPLMTRAEARAERRAWRRALRKRPREDEMPPRFPPGMGTFGGTNDEGRTTVEEGPSENHGQPFLPPGFDSEAS